MAELTRPLVSIVISCFNEKDYIRQVIALVKDSDIHNKEIIIVDDCSTDGTRQILKKEIEQKVDRVIYHERNMGKGAALRSGFGKANGSILIVQDADLEYNPSDYAKLINPIHEGRADVVYGSRFTGSQEHRVLYFWHMVANRFLTSLSNKFTNMNLTDITTCYKAFKKEVIDKIAIEENGFGFESEITAKVARLKCRIYEVGISYNGRTYAQGKKIAWRDGLRILYCIIKYNLLK